MNKKGQALVEFVIILPIIVFILLATIDIGKIFYITNKLENKLNDVVSMYENNKTIDDMEKNVKKEIKDSYLSIKEDDKYIEFKITKDVQIVTPGLNLIFDSPYTVVTKRVIYNE